MPLTKWICDTCRDEIADAGAGLLIWREEDDMKAYDFMIVHKNLDGRACDPGAKAGYISNLTLDHYLGQNGVAWLLSLLSPGPLIGTGTIYPRVRDFDQFVDTFRRLQTPWYEEARSRFGDEEVEHWLSDANEVLPYMPDVLERIAKGTFGG